MGKGKLDWEKTQREAEGHTLSSAISAFTVFILKRERGSIEIRCPTFCAALCLIITFQKLYLFQETPSSTRPEYSFLLSKEQSEEKKQEKKKNHRKWRRALNAGEREDGGLEREAEASAAVRTRITVIIVKAG